MMATTVDITGLDRAVLLMALWSASFDAIVVRQLPPVMRPMPPTLLDARAELERGGGYIDYFHGRVIKCHLEDKIMSTAQYDHGNGQGSAARVVQTLRSA